MPFTPFHFGAHACVALPLQRKLDVPVFILTNVIIDIEPLLVMLFDLDYPLHGYVHPFLGSLVVGALWGIIAYLFRIPMTQLMNLLGLSYEPILRRNILSGALGGCMHVLFDAPLCTDIKPFYPFIANPLYGLISIPHMYILCSMLFIPAFMLYIKSRVRP